MTNLIRKSAYDSTSPEIMFDYIQWWASYFVKVTKLCFVKVTELQLQLFGKKSNYATVTILKKLLVRVTVTFNKFNSDFARVRRTFVFTRPF